MRGKRGRETLGFGVRTRSGTHKSLKTVVIVDQGLSDSVKTSNRITSTIETDLEATRLENDTIGKTGKPDTEDIRLDRHADASDTSMAQLIHQTLTPGGLDAELVPIGKSTKTMKEFDTRDGENGTGQTCTETTHEQRGPCT